MPLYGLDASSNNLGIPDATIHADFIIEKATEGVGYTNPDCNPSYQEARNAGKLVGVYHYARPEANGAVEEAQYFLSQIQGYVRQGVLFLDYETNTNVAWAKQWLDYVYQQTGVRPLIYMSASTANAVDWSPVWADYALWVAAYPSNATVTDYQFDFSQAPNVNWPNGYAMWQFTSHGHLAGYGGNLDLSIFYGDATAWNKFANPDAPTTPPTPPAPVITTQTVSETKEVPFVTTRVEDDSLLIGQTTIRNSGVNGIETVVYTVTLTDGVETDRQVVSDTVTTNPIDEVIAVGTKKADPIPPVTPTVPDQPSKPTQTFGDVLKAIAMAVWKFIKQVIGVK